MEIHNHPRIEKEGKDFVLKLSPSDGVPSEIKLSDVDVLFLSRSAQQIAGEIASGKNPNQDISAKFVAPAKGVEISESLHRDEIHLIFQDQYGGEFGFSMPLQYALQLAAKIAARVKELSSGNPQSRQ